MPIDCNPTPGLTGMSDYGIDTNWPAVQEFPVPSSVAAIGVDFRNGRVYGLLGDHSSVISISTDNAAISGSLGKDIRGDSSSGALPMANMVFNTFTPAANTPFPPTATSALRLTGFFMAPEGDEAFVSDQGSSDLLGATTYSSAIYRWSDPELSHPIVRLPLDAVSFSK